VTEIKAEKGQERKPGGIGDSGNAGESSIGKNGEEREAIDVNG